MTLVHVCGITIGLIAGALAMMFRKGASLHRVAGNIFTIAMLSSTIAAAYLAAFVHPNHANFTGAAITVYLVSTGWFLGRRRDRAINKFDCAALVAVFVLGSADILWGFEAVASPTGVKDRYPAAFYFIFGSIALLFASSDFRMILRGGVAGAERIARHLWRMSLAFLFAVASGYPGQAKLFPMAWRETRLLYVPHLLILMSMLYWMRKMRARRSQSIHVGEPVRGVRSAVIDHGAVDEGPAVEIGADHDPAARFDGGRSYEIGYRDLDEVIGRIDDAVA